MTKLVNPVPLFLDGRGALLDAGFVYIGTFGTDPETPANRLNLFWDKALTIPAAQPLRTLGGVIVNGGNIGFVYFAATDFSISIRDADSNLVAFVPSAFDLGGTSYQPLDTDLTAIAALATTGYGRGFLTLADAAAARALLALGSSAVLDEATAAEYRANTANKVLTTDQVWGAAVSVPLASAAGSVAVDLNLGINFTHTLTENTTLANPSNGKDGQSGKIEITQHAAAAKTMGFGANWLFTGGVDPVISTALSARDVLYYSVLSDGKIHGSLNKALG